MTAPFLAVPQAQRFGGKLMLTLNMAGSALSFLIAPRMADNGVWSLAACFFLMGACQGPLYPAKTAMQQTWLPKGVERVWATRFMSLGSRMAQLAAVALTPRICNSSSWRRVPYVYGGITAVFMVFWQLFAANAPKAHLAAQSASKGATKAVEWRIFKVRPRGTASATACPPPAAG